MANVKTSTTSYIDDEALDNGKAPREPDAPYPTCLAGMSDKEIEQFGRQTTMKMDVIIMPALTIMYILNYLDRQVRPSSLHRRALCLSNDEKAQLLRTSPPPNWRTSWRTSTCLSRSTILA
jgi:hypothetical protein